jgi:enoyl-CoA hydratase/carnithine racemase
MGTVVAMIEFTLAKEGPVAIATMASGENRLGTAAVESWNAMLDGLEADPEVTSLVVTGVDRYWSTGLDLHEVADMSDGQVASFMASVDRLLGRILTLPMVTIAALNGHTYAAGALLALAHDFRVMRGDKGFFCLPSVDVGIPFSVGMSALIVAKLPQPIAHDLVVSCRRIGGVEAERTGVVNHSATEAEVLPMARDMAHSHSGKDAATLTAVKRRLYPLAADLLAPER